MKKRILSVVLAIMMMVCLVGCGSVVHTEGDDDPSMFA